MARVGSVYLREKVCFWKDKVEKSKGGGASVWVSFAQVLVRRKAGSRKEVLARRISEVAFSRRLSLSFNF